MQKEEIKTHLVSGKRISVIELYGSKTFHLENPPKDPKLINESDFNSAIKFLEKKYLIKKTAILKIKNSMKKYYVFLGELNESNSGGE